MLPLLNWLRKWFSIPCVTVAAGQTLNILTVEWTTIAILALAGIPVIIPIAARYIAAVRKTEQGWEFLFREDALGLPSEQIERGIEIQTGTKVDKKEAKSLDKFSLHAKRILVTLWQYQREAFGEDDNRRWGFGVGRLAPD